MNEPAHNFLYRIWPYLALTLAVAGFVVRMLLTSDRLPAVRRALPRAQRLWVGGWPWRLGWVLLVAAHLAGLLFPQAILAWTRTPGRLLALEALGFAVGLAALAACVRAAWQHMRVQPRGGWSLVSDFADSVFLSLMFIGVGSGLLAAGLHRWGSAWGSVTMAPYAASLLHGRPMPAFVEHLPFLVRLHLFTAFAALAAFPASRLAVFPLVWAHRAMALAGRALAAAARPGAAWLRSKTAAWLWPEREVRWLVKARADGGPRKPPGKPPGWWQRPQGNGAGTLKHGGKTV
jgi:nitrate reductase gamma subunit